MQVDPMAVDAMQGELGTTAFVLTTLVKMVAVVVGTLSLVAVLTLAERKIAAWIQDRYGPNRAGPGGLLQPAADGLKNFMKETAEPDAAYKPIFRSRQRSRSSRRC
jgi:NADH-quinone oxidoreductase subunit H